MTSWETPHGVYYCAADACLRLLGLLCHRQMRQHSRSKLIVRLPEIHQRTVDRLREYLLRTFDVHGHVEENDLFRQIILRTANFRIEIC